ncbi:hypothetical protein MMC24_005712 [Lignoscripta atroalba]|nr:hypothetical protein [Lignoscripta atroalba]
MGISYSTAKWLAPTSFAVDFVAQQYGLLSSPNMLDVHNNNLSFWSPQPYFIGGFFFPQQLLQLAWLYRIWKADPNKPNERNDLDQMVDYVPYYALGNFCIASKFISHSHFQAGVDDLVAKLAPMNTNSNTSILTHAVAKTFAGIGVLDLLHNGSIAFFKDVPATMTVKVLTGLGFGLASASSDWIFGGCMVYDLVALAAGQSGSWRTLLSAYAVASAGIVTAKNIARPPYNRQGSGYKPTATEDIQDQV